MNNKWFFIGICAAIAFLLWGKGGKHSCSCTGAGSGAAGGAGAPDAGIAAASGCACSQVSFAPGSVQAPASPSSAFRYPAGFNYSTQAQYSRPGVSGPTIPSRIFSVSNGLVS